MIGGDRFPADVDQCYRCGKYFEADSLYMKIERARPPASPLQITLYCWDCAVALGGNPQ